MSQAKLAYGVTVFPCNVNLCDYPSCLFFFVFERSLVLTLSTCAMLVVYTPK